MRLQRGFTLVELLVVFAMLGLMMAVAPAAYDRMHESVQYRNAVRTVLSELRQARHLALTEGREVRFRVDMANRTYGVEGGRNTSLPQPLEVRATVATVEIDASGAAGISFLPSGGATGGTLEIVRPAGAGTRIMVDWLSGSIAQSRIAQ